MNRSKFIALLRLSWVPSGRLVLWAGLMLGNFSVLATGLLAPPLTLDPWYSDARPVVAASAMEQAVFAESLDRFSQRRERDDFSAIEGFLQRFPRGAWAPALRLRLVEELYLTGWCSKAVRSLEDLWADRGRYPGLGAAVTFTRAGVQLAELYARLGRRADVERVVAELGNASLRLDDEETLRGVKQGLATMQTRPEAAFRCGALALERVRVFLNPTNAGHAAILGSKSSPDGMSLAEVAALSVELGMNYQMAFRPAGAPLVTPAVMHLRVGHFVAAVRERRGQVQIEDPTGWETTFASRAAVEAETSGYFLIPPGPLPQGWRRVESAEGATVIGRNGVRENDPDGAGKCDAKVHPRGGGRASPGMATWDVHLMLVSQQIIDTPLGYQPPYGPPVYVTWRHTQRANRRFGYKPTWTHSWTGQIYENPRTPLGDLWLQEEGGWERFSPLDDEGLSYQGRIFNSGRVTHSGGTNLVWEFPDGSKRVYSTFAGTNVVWGRIFHLTAVEDVAGHRVTIQVLPNGRVESLTDPLGQVTRFFYELPDPGIPPDHNPPLDPVNPQLPTSGVTANLDYTNQVTRIVDPFGRTAVLQYAKVERYITGFCGGGVGDCPFYYYHYDLTNITDVAGLSSQFVYDGSGSWVSNLVTPYGVTRFNWVSPQAGSYAIEVMDPEGGTERIEFAPYAAGDLEKTLANLPQGMRTDGSSFAVAHWDQKAYAESWHVGSLDGATLYLFQSSETLSSAGRVLKGIKRPLENAVWFNYPGQGSASLPGIGNQPTRIGRVLDDGATQLWQAERDAWGNVILSVDPEGRTFRYIYSTNFIDLLEVQQARNGQNERLLRITWNSQHRPLTVTDAAGQMTRFAYNTRGQLTTVINARNETNRFAYDAHGNLTAIDGPLPGSQDQNTFTYDAFGRVRTAADPDGYTLTFDYDALDRLTRMTFPDGTAQTMTYDRMDLGTVRDRLGRETRYEYDGLRHLIAVQDALGRVKRFLWCGCGSLEAIIDPLGRMTQWHRDLQGRVITKEYADGSKITFDYEKTTSRLRQKRDEQNQLTEYRYDLADLLVSRRYLNAHQPTPDVTFTYDPDHRRVASMTDGNGTTTYRYYPINGSPGAGRLAIVDGPWANDDVTYTYDELGRVSERAIHGVAVKRTYDAAGRLMRMTNELGAFDYTWEGGSDRLSAVNYPNGQHSEYAYYNNARDQLLERITHLRPGGAKLSEFSYGYNAERQITNWTQFQAGRLKNWIPAYDAMDRLTNLVETVSGSPPSVMAWTYDDADNRIWEQIQSDRREFTYNALNQLTGFSTNPPVPPAAYEWDAENRLVAISNATGRVEFSYDGLDRRTRITERNATTIVSDRRYLWCGLQLCEERDVTGAVVLKRYSSHGLQNLGAPELAVGSYFFTRDHLGTLREITAGTGTAFDYSAFGEQQTLSGGLPADFGFTGHFQNRKTATVLAPFRGYSPAIARWLNRDPLGEGGGQNLYVYVRDNPINLVDPDGADPAGPPSHPAFADIINRVAADPPFVSFADDPAYRSKGNQAGNSRNAVLRKDKKSWELPAPKGNQDYVCDGIAQRADTLIRNQIYPGGKLYGKGIKASDVIHRRRTDTFLESDHEAVMITLDSGDQYVFDWHATLDVRNPEISTRADFCKDATCGPPGSTPSDLQDFIKDLFR